MRVVISGLSMQGFITDEVEVGSRVGGVKTRICVFWLVVFEANKQEFRLKGVETLKKHVIIQVERESVFR